MALPSDKPFDRLRVLPVRLIINQMGTFVKLALLDLQGQFAF